MFVSPQSIAQFVADDDEEGSIIAESFPDSEDADALMAPAASVLSTPNITISPDVFFGSYTDETESGPTLEVEPAPEQPPESTELVDNSLLQSVQAVTIVSDSSSGEFSHSAGADVLVE